MCEEILNRCSVTFFFDEGAEGKEYKCTTFHFISSFIINGDLWGYEGKKVHDILHEGCGMGMHWHSIVLLPSHDDGTPVVQNRSVINRYFTKSGQYRCTKCRHYAGKTVNGDYPVCPCGIEQRSVESCMQCVKIGRGAHTSDCSSCGNHIAVRPIENRGHFLNTLQYQRQKLLYKSEPCSDKCKKCNQCFAYLADFEKGSLVYRNYISDYLITPPTYNEHVTERSRKRKANFEYQKESRSKRNQHYNLVYPISKVSDNINL